MTGIDVVLVNYNSGQYLAEAVTALARSKVDQAPLATVVVVDNLSTDTSLADLGACSLPLTILRNPVNRGFAAACKQGAALGKGHLILFLNPDTQLAPDCLARLVRRLDSDPTIGAVGPLLLSFAGHIQRTCTRLPRPLDFVAMACGLHLLSPRFDIRLSEARHRVSGPVDHVIGACYLVRRELYERLGGFDERFFVYLEDLDLSWRIAQAGLRVWFEPEAVCLHQGGGSSRQVPVQRLVYSLESRVVFAKLHFAGLWPALIAASGLVADPLARAAHGLLRMDVKEVGIAARTSWRLWRSPRLWRTLCAKVEPAPGRTSQMS
jgi:N-acetylglucosaminyl-diphospho-decaprenol L-rhamnosyltransferase